VSTNVLTFTARRFLRAKSLLSCSSASFMLSSWEVAKSFKAIYGKVKAFLNLSTECTLIIGATRLLEANSLLLVIRFLIAIAWFKWSAFNVELNLSTSSFIFYNSSL
jgi:hypothetical protein